MHKTRLTQNMKAKHTSNAKKKKHASNAKTKTRRRERERERERIIDRITWSHFPSTPWKNLSV